MARFSAIITAAIGAISKWCSSNRVGEVSGSRGWSIPSEHDRARVDLTILLATARHLPPLKFLDGSESALRHLEIAVSSIRVTAADGRRGFRH